MKIRQTSSRRAFLQRVPKVFALAVMILMGFLAWQQATADEFVGSWDGPYCWPVGATHLAHLPPSGESETGRILLWPATFDSQPIETWLWNPKNGCFDENPPGNTVPGCFTSVQNTTTNLFCAGQTALADGTILTAGGHHGDISGADVGLADTNLFIRDSVTGEWGEWRIFAGGVPKMVEPRWYPTVTTLPDGRALVVSGSDSACSNSGEPCAGDAACNGGTCDVVIIGIPEIWDPAVDPPGWTPFANTAFLDMPFYPLNFVLPDGKLFYAGSEGEHGSAGVLSTDTRKLDIGPQTWEVVGNSPNVPGGSAVMYAPGKVLKSGGGNSVDGAMVIDMNEGVPAWTDVGPMTIGRRRHQMTLLPDGTVLVTGGTESGNREYMHACDGGTRNGAECTIAGLPPGDPGGCAGNETSGKGCPVACVECDEDECVGGPDAGMACAMDADCADNATCDGGPDAGMACNAHDDCSGEHECIEGAQVWVAAAEIYDPDDGPLGSWTPMAAMKTPRMYHSSAMLLPDGRVLSAGGGPENFGGAIHSYPTVEFYSPPYFYKGSRPEIKDSPEAICYDTNFRMTSSDAVAAGRVTLIRLGTVTHSFDSDQRFQELTIASQQDNLFLVTAPENANDAPPGYYMLFFLSEDEDVPSIGAYVQMVETCCEPRSQGYWHRQCLGVAADENNLATSGIDPGRNGRGPKAPTEPEFSKTLMPEVNGLLEAALGPSEAFSCATGMDADPASDPCERAIKQYTALLFNVASDRLQLSCELDLSGEGCNSTSVDLLLDELADLINADDCTVAASCAAAVNEGTALVEAALAGLGVQSDPVTETVFDVTTPAIRPGSGARGQAGVAPDSAASPASETVGDSAAVIVAVAARPGIERERVSQETANETDATELRAIRRHLSVLADSSALAQVWEVSRDALLTTLSGGFDPELRLEIAGALIRRVDVSFHSLLAAHLEDLRKEAADFGKEDLAREAEQLLKQLGSTGE